MDFCRAASEAKGQEFCVARNLIDGLLPRGKRPVAPEAKSIVLTLILFVLRNAPDARKGKDFIPEHTCKYVKGRVRSPDNAAGHL